VRNNDHNSSAHSRANLTSASSGQSASQSASSGANNDAEDYSFVDNVPKFGDRSKKKSDLLMQEDSVLHMEERLVQVMCVCVCVCACMFMFIISRMFC
jgi:hypothetical protein